MRILDTIDSYAETKGERTAIRNSSGQEINYRQLKEFSGKLAAYLQQTLADDKSPIVVYGHKNPYMAVCFLACVKSGRPYCPVDVTVPQERLSDIVAATRTPVVLATEQCPIQSTKCLGISEIKTAISEMPAEISPEYFVGPEDLFYILFTSGSTGKPKGVQITEDCLFHFVSWAKTLGGTLSTAEQNTFLNQAPFSFDLSVMDLYTSLYTGSKLWCLKKTVQSDMNKLFCSLRESGASVWVSTPSFANLCLADAAFQKEMLPCLARFLFCGETLPNATAAALQNRFPDAAIVNTYGPTESTVAVTQVVVTREMSGKNTPLPVGEAKPGTFLQIVNAQGDPLPEGQKGEIVIIGDSVSTGYFKRPDLTEKSFLIKTVQGKPYRAYRTGDEGYLENGQLYYCGRIDLQVKLHGYRIEIEDIEKNIMKLPGIKSAVVVPVWKDGSVNSLTAFAVPEGKQTGGLAAVQKLKKGLSAYLPAYMIPKRVIFTENLPMTANGKIDRKALLNMII